MKLSSDEFKKLQKEWNERLKVEGFDHRNCSYPRIDPFRKEMQEEYFRILGHFVNDPDTTFKSEIDRYILIRYSEGAKIAEIVTELAARRTPRERLAIRIIIRRYHVSWNIRHHTHKELDRRNR